MWFILRGEFIKQFCAQEQCYRPYQFLTPLCSLEIRTLSKCSQTANFKQHIFLCHSQSYTVRVYDCPLRDPRFSRRSKNFRSAEFWLCVVRQAGTNLSQQWDVSVFRAEEYTSTPFYLLPMSSEQKCAYILKMKKGNRTVGTPFYTEYEYSRFLTNISA